MTDNERLLLKRAKKGDVDAFEQLIEKYQKKVYNIALKMLGNKEDAYDMSQEVFIRVYRSIDKFKEQASLSTWIYKITTNVCLDEIRRRKNRFTVSIDDDMELNDSKVKRQIEYDGPSPEIIVEENELREIINKSIQQLPEQYRVVTILRDIQGFSYEEIANILDVPQGTVKSRINRARAMLRDILYEKKELLNKNYVI